MDWRALPLAKAFVAVIIAVTTNTLALPEVAATAKVRKERNKERATTPGSKINTPGGPCAFRCRRRRRGYRLPRFLSPGEGSLRGRKGSLSVSRHAVTLH